MSSQRLLHFLGSVHDFEAFGSSRSMSTVMRNLFLSHWLHLAVVLCWFSGIVMHVGFQGNFDVWVDNPLRISFVAHALWEPHLMPEATGFTTSYSGLSFWMRTVGFTSSGQILHFSLAPEVVAFALMPLIGHWNGAGLERTFLNVQNMRAPLLPGLSFLWAGHLAWVVMKDGNAVGNNHSVLSLLSFVGDLSPISRSIFVTDLIHHHLAVGILGFCLITITGLAASRIRALLNLGYHMQVAVACFGLASIVFLVAQHMLWMPSAGFIHFSLPTCNALFAHHLWIASTLLVGAFVHFALFTLREICFKTHFVSILSWLALFLGFHVLGIYVHNDVVYAFGSADKGFLIQPILAQSIQSYANMQVLYVFCPADFLLHHALALCVHTTTLILVKGAVDASGSLLFAEKRQHGFGFSCDGPGRGGTCDISAWDSIYLGVFWVLNTLGWVLFYEHYRSIVSFDAFASTGSTLLGWFRDYLWQSSGNLVNGFTFSGSNELAVLAWGFLLGHLIWATSFMFLISWRGYWQELIESLLLIHLKTPVIVSIWTLGFTPVALSILQARFIGLAHFTVGFIRTFDAFLLSV